ncbi:hypothetical protein A4S05_24530 [Nostoc sp. KVJ20]|nr:hypothetical protein A4S05_24530 [Nostoc sp. KVJ20]
MFALIFSLVVVLSLLTSKAVASLNHQKLLPALIAAIGQDLLQYRENFGDYNRNSKESQSFLC